MGSLVSSITGIRALNHFEDACIAQKMSWASRRETTRIEDQAYCLLGLFGVNMPPLYGEGKKAFNRFQLEILKESDDESLFAWTDKDPDGSNDGGLLAPSPLWFSECGYVRRKRFDMDRPAFAMTNKGLRMELLLREQPGADVGEYLPH